MTQANKLILSKIGVDPSSVKFINPIWKRAHFRASVNWLTKYHATQSASNLQKVYGYLEAIYHLSVVEAWRESSEIALIPIDSPTNEELHEQLHTWGYYQQQINIYNLLLGKINYRWDIICSSGLANTFDLLGDYRQAEINYEEWKNIAKDNNDVREEALAICSLGIDLKEPSSGEIITKAFIPILDDIRSLPPPYIRMHYRAALNFLTKYRIQLDSSNIETMRGVLEAFHHLCEVEDWKSASKILTVRLKPDRRNELCDQLLVWGHNTEVRNLYDRLLQKLDTRWDGICLFGIGRVDNILGNVNQAIEHLEGSLDIFRHIGDRRKEGLILEQLGISYRFLESSKAVNFHQESVLIAQEIGYQIGQATSLGELGITYTLFEEDKLALDYLQKSLVLTQDISRKVERTIPLNGLASFYLRQSEFERSIEFAQTQLILSREIGYLNSIGNAIYTLGEIDTKTNNYSSALAKTQEALEIFRDIGNRTGVARTWKNLAELNYKLGEFEQAEEYCNMAIEITTELNIPLLRDCQDLAIQIAGSISSQNK